MAAIQSTLTKYSTPYRPSPGLYFGAPIHQHAGSGSGVGTASTVSLATKAKSGSGDGVGSSSATGLRIVPRTATGSAAGGDTAVTSGPTQFRLGGLTDYSFPYLNGGRLYVGAPIKQREGTGSGTGSQSATSFPTRARMGSGSGTGSESGTGVRIAFRTATGSGTGGDTAITSGPFQLRLGAVTDYSFPYLGGGRYYLGHAYYLRTATGSGSGESISAGFLTRARMGTGSGVGTSVGTGAVVFFKTASGSGTSSSEATIYKFHMFRPPTAFDGPTTLVGGDRVANRLARFYRPRERGINVYKLVDSTFTQVDQSDYTNITKVYHGGHIHQLTEEEYADLLGAGYGAYLT
jgi:hypothetical protein